MRLRPYRLTETAHPLLIDRVRRMYNESLTFLSTKPLTPKTPAEQYKWWESLDFSKVTIHVYSLEEKPEEIVAFSMVTDRGNHCTPMFAIDPAYWGNGFAHEIIKHYLQIAYPKPLLGEQLTSNEAICALNRKYGWLVEYEYMGVEHLINENKAGAEPDWAKAYLDYQNGETP